MGIFFELSRVCLPTYVYVLFTLKAASTLSSLYVKQPWKESCLTKYFEKLFCICRYLFGLQKVLLLLCSSASFLFKISFLLHQTESEYI